jgi:hypothetical protein
MEIIAKNQEDLNKAKAVITVGCGPDGDEGNEPTFTYAITADGLSINRCTDDGQCMGGVDLGLHDLHALCRVGWLTPDEATAARARLFPDLEAELPANDQLAADVEKLRSAALEAVDRNPGMALGSVAPALLRVLEALVVRTSQLQRHESAGCSSSGGMQVTEVRRMKPQPACEAYSSEELAQRMMQICGCKGQWDCDCVTVRNKASSELWGEYNCRRLGKQAA